MKKILKNKENIFTLFLSLIFVLSFLVRFLGLGYSHFYGDETKTFYLDKTITADKFFLDQRKGPLQFFVVWCVENIINGYDELLTRIPFAIAGFLSVLVFYLLVKRLFNKYISLVSAILFSFSGFSIAFSRTIQYQSFLVFFGLLAIYLFTLYLDSLNNINKDSADKNIVSNRNDVSKKKLFRFKKKNYFLILSSLSLVLAFYSHYDAIFFILPIIYLLLSEVGFKKIKYKELLLFFILPVVSLLSFFYVPYVLKGYFEANTINYMGRRFLGDGEMGLNYSLFTIFVYNPCKLLFVLFLLPLGLFFTKKLDSNSKLLIFWFVIPFIFFQVIVINPGTHIQNYLIPLYILVAYTICKGYENIQKVYVKKICVVLTVAVLSIIVYKNMTIYIPGLSSGYPWNYYENLHEKYQVFIYGFPYNRGWKDIQTYIYSLNGVRGVYTNDNDVMAKYYLHKLTYTPPGSNFLPQYYIHVFNNQEFTQKKESTRIWNEEFISKYEKIKEFYVDNSLVSVVYKLKTLPNTDKMSF